MEEEEQAPSHNELLQFCTNVDEFLTEFTNSSYHATLLAKQIRLICFNPRRWLADLSILVADTWKLNIDLHYIQALGGMYAF